MEWRQAHCHCFRKSTDRSECRYAEIEKEFLASAWACEKFTKYLIGLDRSELQTDHKPLVSLMTTKDIDRTPVRCQRLLMRLMRLNNEIKHVPGKHSFIADALSISPLDHSLADKDIDKNLSAYVDAVEASCPSAVHVWMSRGQRRRAAAGDQRRLQWLATCGAYLLAGIPTGTRQTLQH